MISSIIELLIKIIAALWIIPSFGFVAVCVTEPVTWLMMTAFLIMVYLMKTKKYSLFQQLQPPVAGFPTTFDSLQQLDRLFLFCPERDNTKEEEPK